jgi:hypothetical protein
MSGNIQVDDLQVVWEQLNAVLYDLTQGTPSDAVEAVEDCIARLESLGVGDSNEYDGQPDEAQEWHDFDPDC